MPRDYFDEEVARAYESRWPQLFDPAVVGPTVDVLADLAGAGAALEFGIGTGRIALPLSRRGVPVQGIDLSEAMVSEFRTKPGSDAIGVTIGDFATTRVDGRFSLVFLLRNTIMNLTTQEEQVRCFANAAAHLEPGGHFLVEVIVPELRRLPPGERVHPFDVSPTHLGFDTFEVATQTCTSHHLWFEEDGGVTRFSAPFRYVWPSELDLMARLAAMTLSARWADWDRSPFADESRSHVSVWATPRDIVGDIPDHGRAEGGGTRL